MATSSPSQNVKEPEVDEEFIKLLTQDQPLTRFKAKKQNQFDQYPDNHLVQRMQGCLIGVAVGDALGASVEFRPYAYLKANEVKDMQSGGTWGLDKGYWTDDTSMTLCLAASLLVKREFDPYDQFQRYRDWYRNGYMSSTGKCFDIGKSTREAIIEFERLNEGFEQELKKNEIKTGDPKFEKRIKEEFEKRREKLNLGANDAAGNGPLMRLAALPCAFHTRASYIDLQKYIVTATRLTHGDPKAVDACKFYAGLIAYALNGTKKETLLHPQFYKDYLKLELDPEVQEVAKGSYKKKKNGYADGIRGKGYIVNSLEAALWAFYNDNNDFKTGVLLAVNLGDDTDTTAAIYGELAGAVYGIQGIPKEWVKQVYKHEFIIAIANNLYAARELFQQSIQRSNWDDDEDGNGQGFGGGTGTPRHQSSTSTDDKSKSNSNDKDKNKNNEQTNQSDSGKQRNQNQNHRGDRSGSATTFDSTNNSNSSSANNNEKQSEKNQKNNKNGQSSDSKRNNNVFTE